MTEQYLEKLIQKFADGSATPEEIEKLNKWYRSSKIHDVQWPSSDPLEKQIVSERMLNRLQLGLARPQAKLVRFKWMKIAALLVLLAGIATVLLYLLRPGQDNYILISNPSHQIRSFRLPDSSLVWLNASSSIRYHELFTEKRDIQLEGEAFFEVTHDPAHPFRVEAGGIRTTVLGTTFNVRAYKSSGTTDVSVLSGRVQVSNEKKQFGVLSPSYRLQFNRQSQTAITNQVDSSHVIAWKNGKLQFQGESFKEIAVALENWYNVKVELSDKITNCRYYMSVENTLRLKSRV